MRIAMYVLGTELVSFETGPECTRTPADDDQNDADEAEDPHARRPRPSAGAGTALAAGELGPDTSLGFTRPWRHVEIDTEDIHGGRDAVTALAGTHLPTACSTDRKARK